MSSLRGKEVLPALVRNHQEEYAEMSVRERKALVHEFEEQKATIAKSFHSSAKSRINDTTQTLGAIENEVRSLCINTWIVTNAACLDS